MRLLIAIVMLLTALYVYIFVMDLLVSTLEAPKNSGDKTSSFRSGDYDGTR